MSDVYHTLFYYTTMVSITNKQLFSRYPYKRDRAIEIVKLSPVLAKVAYERGYKHADIRQVLNQNGFYTRLCVIGVENTFLTYVFRRRIIRSGVHISADKANHLTVLLDCVEYIHVYCEPSDLEN